MFTSSSLQIGDLSSKQMAVIAENILSINVSYTMDMASQLSFIVIDPSFEMAANNYFMVGRDVIYETTGIRDVTVWGSQNPGGIPVLSRIRHTYEIASVSVQQNGSASPQWTIEAMPKAIQQMKRDKKPGNIGGSGYEFVRKAAIKYGLKFVGEKSSRIKGASKNSGDGQQDSVWDVITNIASQSQYVVFVSDGTLYFATQKWLMYKWGTELIRGAVKKGKDGKPLLDKDGKQQRHPDKKYIPMEYPAKSEKFRAAFEVLQLPNLRKSENDPMSGDGTLLVARDNGVRLRPGMTIRINNVPTMNKYYLITSVSFGEQITDPVTVEFRTPERLEVNGKQPKIPLLPIGKTYSSEYFQPSPRLGVTSIGQPIYNDTTPPFVSIGTTINPVGRNTSIALPNSRRPLNYPNDNYIFEALKEPSVTIESVFVTGNIDLWNRPVYVISDSNLYNCATSRPYIYPTRTAFLSDFPDPDIITGATKSGSLITYTSTGHSHGLLSSSESSDGRYVTITGIAPSGYNVSDCKVVASTANTFTVETNDTSAVGAYVSGGLVEQYGYAITERLWCSSSSPVLLSNVDAGTKYDTEDVHHGLFFSPLRARAYVRVLIKLQKIIVLERFPENGQKIWAGTTAPILRCS